MWPYDPESDLARIGRTHTFMKIVAQTAKSKGLTDPLLADNFLSAVLGQITVDSALKGQMLSLVLRYRDLDVDGVAETTLPTTAVNDYDYDGYNIGDVLFPVQPDDNNVIRAWDSHALPPTQEPKSVSVVSITGNYQAALDAGHSLATDGLKVVSETTGSVPSDTSETLVLYHPGQISYALEVMKYLSGAVMMEIAPSLAPGTVQVQLGSSVNVTTTHTPTTTSASASSSTTSPAGSASSSVAPSSTTPKAPAGTTAPKKHVVATTVPTPGGLTPSAASDEQAPWDPRSC